MADGPRNPEPRGYREGAFRNDGPGKYSGKTVLWQPHPCAPQVSAAMDYAAELDFGRLGPALLEVARCTWREGLFPSSAKPVTTIDAPPIRAGEGAAGAGAAPTPQTPT